LSAGSRGNFNKGKVELSYNRRQGDKELVKVVFTEEDRKNLKSLTDEVPKLRSLIEELIETLEILGDETLMESITVSEKDVKEGRLLGLKELLKELSLDEREI